MRLSEGAAAPAAPGSSPVTRAGRLRPGGRVGAGLPAGLWALLAGASAPGLRLMLRWRVRHGKEVAARLPERRGIDAAARPPGLLLWVHAASVGETASILPVLAALPATLSVLLTTATVTGGELAERRLDELGLAGRVRHRLAPLDVPGWARRFLDHWRPDAAAFVESELWPNLLAACRARAIPTALLNARMSERSARSWRRAPGFARRVLGGFDLVLAQSEADAARLGGLGAAAVSAPGNLKFAAADLPVDAALLARIAAQLGGRPVWLAASTHPGEERVVAGVHRRLAAAHPGLVTIIAPRHPGRGAALAAELSGPDGGGLLVARHGAGEPPPAGGLWLFDALGELGTLFHATGIAFMGNSLAVGPAPGAGPGGGHNPIEPARAGCAVASGPRTANFTEIVLRLQAAGALCVVADEAALAGWVDRMLRDAAARHGAAAAGHAASLGFAALPAQVAAALVTLLGRQHA